MNLRLRRAFGSTWCALVFAALPVGASAYCIGWDKSLPDYDPRYYSIEHEFNRAKYVVKVKVFGETFDRPVGKSLTVDTCGNSKPLGKARVLLRTLAKLGAAPARRASAIRRPLHLPS